MIPGHLEVCLIVTFFILAVIMAQVSSCCTRCSKNCKKRIVCVGVNSPVDKLAGQHSNKQRQMHFTSLAEVI